MQGLLTGIGLKDVVVETPVFVVSDAPSVIDFTEEILKNLRWREGGSVCGK